MRYDLAGAAPQRVHVLGAPAELAVFAAASP